MGRLAGAFGDGLFRLAEHDGEVVGTASALDTLLERSAKRKGLLNS